MTIHEDLGDFFKAKENDFRMSIDKSMHTIIRLDGMRFHNFTRPFLYPFDPFLRYALDTSLLRVLQKELKGYYALVYFQSDEASIILPAITEADIELPFGGRVEKLIATLLQWNTQFYQTLVTLYQNALRTLDPTVFTPLFGCINSLNRLRDERDIRMDEYIQKVAFFISQNAPSFDCRFLQVSTTDEIGEYLQWRRQDAIRNYKNMLGRMFYSSKAMHKLSANDVIAKLESDYHIQYEDFPAIFKRGTVYRTEKYASLFADGFYDADDATKTFQAYVMQTCETIPLNRLFLPYVAQKEEKN